MRGLRGRLFAAILGASLLCVGASLALGVALTREAVRDSIRDELADQADVLATRLARLPAGVSLLDVPAAQRPRLGRRLRRGRAGGGPAPGGAPPGRPPPRGGPAAGPPPGAPPPGPPPRGERGRPPPRPRVVTLTRARRLLPREAGARLAAGRAADGTATIRGRRELFAARPVRGVVVIVTRSADLGSSDYGRYLTALLLGGALAAVLAAGAAALLARRLTAPLRRVSEAARALAAGRDPSPLPPEPTAELDALAGSFNHMAAELARAREAERSVLLSVSHELRTPLTAIRGYAEGVEDGTIDPADAAPVVAREAERLERLVADLLALARLEQGVLEVRREAVDLAEVAGEVERRLHPRARDAGVTVRVEGAGPAGATGDRDRVLQVVTNLVDNAIRVTPAGGTVTVAVAPGQVTVSDTGPGIAAEDLPHAFERFHLRRRGDGSPDGAGLGLAIVRELTEAMGGEVSVESEPNRGATFTVRLPAG